jgi:hypothetical protein
MSGRPSRNSPRNNSSNKTDLGSCPKSCSCSKWLSCPPPENGKPVSWSDAGTCRSPSNCAGKSSAIPRRGFTGYYAENVLWIGLFGLAFWDIVFLSLPGTFFNRYQRGPKDLFRPEFRRRRVRPIEERLRHIQSTPSWPEKMLRLYDRKEGIASDLVHWRFLPRELVERSVRTIPREHLVAIFDKLGEYPGGNKSGFPDLILFAPSRRRKAPRDPLSPDPCAVAEIDNRIQPDFFG